MANKLWMQRFAKWHIWLGWLVGFPIVMWTATGLFMVAKPIDEVRGNHLRLDSEAQPLVLDGSNIASPDANLKELRVVMQDGRAVAIATTLDGAIERFDMRYGQGIAPVTAEQAAEISSQKIVGGDKIEAVTAFEADEVPFDFRRPMRVWQVKLADGTNVYIGRDTGEIEAVRTSWWRWFDFMWGLHIMDLQTREDTSHPILILFAALGLIGSVLGSILMFRRRKAKAKVEKTA